MVLACQTASQVLGIDCHCGSPRTAANPISGRAEHHPGGHHERRPARHGTGLGVGVAKPGAAQSANRATAPAKSGVANNAVHAFHGMPSAPNGMIANATTP